jgi:hypothetical protein
MIATTTEPAAETLSPVEKFLESVEGDLFSDIVIRACVLDLAMRKKILTKAQVKKLAGLREEVQAAWKKAMPVALGAATLALEDLDEEEDPEKPTHGIAESDQFTQDNAEACITFLEKQEKRKPVRSEKLGPLSYPLF